MISTAHGRVAAGSWLALALVVPSAACPSHERPSPPAVPSAPHVEPTPPTPPTPVETAPPPAAPMPVLEPPPPITTDVDPTIFQWAHPTDEDASLLLVIQLDGGEESERLRNLARAQEGRARPLTGIGWPQRFARGDAWLVFAASGSTFKAKVRGFWPTLQDDDRIEVSVMLGRAPEGLAVRPRDWKGRPHPTMDWQRDLADDDPAMAEIWSVLRRVTDDALLAELVERSALPTGDVRVFEGRFVGGTHLVCLRARGEAPDSPHMASVVLLDFEGRVTVIVPVAPAPYADHDVSGILDLDGDGYEEAIISRAGSSNNEEHLLYWREGRPVLEPLVAEDVPVARSDLGDR